MYLKYAQAGQLKEASTAVEQFHAKENLYRKLLDSWTEIAPAKCGKSTSKPGFVAFESITREHDGGFSFARDDTNSAKVSIDELARRLDAKPDVVRSTLDTMNLVGSPEIIQSGAELKSVSRKTINMDIFPSTSLAQTPPQSPLGANSRATSKQIIQGNISG